MNIIRKEVTLMIFYDYALNEKKIKFKFYFKAIFYSTKFKITPWNSVLGIQSKCKLKSFFFIPFNSWS